MDFVKPFERFWTAKRGSLNINNPARTYENLHKKLETFHSIAEIDDYVCTLRTRKESTRKIMVAFFDYLKNVEMIQIDESVLYTKRFYDSDTARRLEIAKFLHTPKTKEQIMDEFDITERTINNDLQELELGVRLFNSTVRIERVDNEDRMVQYKTTVHPIFLPLNMTEVFAMTKYLENTIDERDPNGATILSIVDRIKGQLSDYAWEHLYPDKKRRKNINDFIDDEKMAMQREHTLMYLMKSGKTCTFIWQNQEYRGKVLCKEDKGYEIILEKDGSILPADLKEVDILPDSFEYK